MMNTFVIKIMLVTSVYWAVLVSTMNFMNALAATLGVVMGLLLPQIVGFIITGKWEHLDK